MSSLIEIEQRDGICILHCRGRFVAGPDFEQVQAKIGEIRRLNCAKVLADFREVLSIGSVGISFIVTVYNSVIRSGGHFVIADVVAPVRKVLDLTKLSTIIPIAEDLPSALAAIHGEDSDRTDGGEGIARPASCS
jgi:anti-anti-sigma factor